MTNRIDQIRTVVADVFKRFSRYARLDESTEADTRCEIVDKILEAVGWAISEIRRELHTGTGDWIDYCLRARGHSWLVVEAKRAGRTFFIDYSNARSLSFSVSTLLRRGGSSVKEAFRQAANYCNDISSPFACVTNGLQWCFFRGLSSERKSWKQGNAIVFDGPEGPKGILDNFDEFFLCLGQSNAGGTFLPSRLLFASDGQVPVPLRPRDSIGITRPPADDEKLAALRDISNFLFSDLVTPDKKQMLNSCYVSPGGEFEFDSSVRRLLEDSGKDIFDESYDVHEGGPENFKRQVDLTTSLFHPILVVGHRGAGKSTFIHKALDQYREERSAFYAHIDLKGWGRTANFDSEREENKVSKQILDKLSRVAITILKNSPEAKDRIDEADPYSRFALKTMLREDLKRERSLAPELWESDPSAWPRIEYEIISSYKNKPQELLVHYIRHLAARFRLIDSDGNKVGYKILIVLDDLDDSSPEYQAFIYEFAKNLVRRTRILVVVAIREDTFDMGQISGGFLSGGTHQFVFHVVAPALDEVVKRRVKYGKFCKAKSLIPRSLRKLKDILDQVCDDTKLIILDNGAKGAALLASLSGRDIRLGLNMVGFVLRGRIHLDENPKSDLDFNLRCLLAESILRSDTRLHIHNCFEAEPTSPPFHCLRLRLLSYFAWVINHSCPK